MGTAATPPPEMPRIQQLLRNHISQRPILHLSFFDGIGAASVALQYLGANIVFTLSWETNPQCQALLQHHFQSIQHGDVSILTRPQLNEIIRHAAQGTEDLIILITAGPPCVDFSRLRNHPPTGEPVIQTDRTHTWHQRRLEPPILDPVSPRERGPTRGSQ